MTRTIPSPFQQFIRSEAAAGVFLFGAAVAALVWANSPWAGAYLDLKALPVSIAVGGSSLGHGLEWWVNDGLMSVFFLLVGLEIKRELLIGELTDRRRAGLAVWAALGGMVVPALVYSGLNLGGPGAHGWGVPMATDIAFALGVLSLLGERVPLSIKVFLTALAIVDDLGAVLVIAVFYTENLDLGALALGAGVYGLALVAGFLRVRRLEVYLGLGAVLWVFTVRSGLHPTVAGVLLALAVPLNRRVVPPEALLQEAVRDGSCDTCEEAGVRLERLEQALEDAQSPLHRLEHELHPFVTYLVLPLFALFNAGVPISKLAGAGAVEAGVFFGLVLGKPLGVLSGAWLAVRLRLGALPPGVGWGQMAAAGLLAGVGFTMALFIAGLAFGEGARVDAARLGAMAASAVAAIAATVAFGLSSRNTTPGLEAMPEA